MDQEKLRVLVVDDEFGIREGCKAFLAMEGFEVETAEDGFAGFKLFSEKRDYAVALIDLKMPGMSGMELIEKIRALDEDIIMFVITAYADFDTAVEATKRGAYGYIPKPFTPDEVTLPIRRGLEKRALALEAKRLREERENRLLELSFERSQSSTIIQCMSDGVLVINRDRQLVLCNDAARRIIPGGEAWSLPAPLSALRWPEELIRLLGRIISAEAGSVIVFKEITLGKSVFMANVSPVPDPGRGIAGAVAVLRDITALKELETAKNMFVSMVAHEVKRPLGVIEGYLNFLLSGMAGQDPNRDREFLERSLLRARTLREMVSELMNLTAMETGNFLLKREPLDLGRIIAETVANNQEKARDKQIELRYEAGEKTGGESVLADREAMLSVFSNLIDNAVKYTPELGHVVVRLEDSENYLQASVSDDGIGLSPEEQEKLFEEFYRARNRYTAKIPGTGLGLHLAKRFVEMHQGRIEVASAPGQGSSFTVWIPKRKL